MNWYSNLVNKLPNWLQAAWNTALATFFGVFGAASIGWLGDLANAVEDGGDIPSVAVVTSAAVAGASAAAAGLINAVVRFLQTHFGTGSVPSYGPADSTDSEGFADYPKA